MRRHAVQGQSSARTSRRDRLAADAHGWGKGYATEAANASLRDVFERTHLKEVLTQPLRTTFGRRRLSSG